MSSGYLVSAVVLLLALARPSIAQGVDGTMRDKAIGSGVVSATLRKLKQTCIFSNDFYFLRRVAWVESHFGSDVGTFGRAEPRGIWQLSRRAFNATQDTAARPQLHAIYQKLEAELGVRWRDVTYAEEYMNKPLYNAIAARIFLQVKPPANQIPPALDDQAPYWKREYSIQPWATADRFLKDVTGMPQCRSAGVDLVLLLDGSGSIKPSGFVQIKNVVYQIINSLEIGANRSNVAIFVFSTSVEEYVSFAHTHLQNKNDLLRIVTDIVYPAGWTNTHLGLASARNEFSAARAMSLGFPRQLILLTDGQSTEPSSTRAEAAVLRTLPWLEVYSIGMGPDFNTGLPLDEITNIASSPKCTHVITTPTVSQIAALTDDLHEANCLASAPICGGGSANCSGATITGRLSPGDVRYFRDEADRAVGRSYRLSTDRWTLRLYVSAKFENPGEGLYEFRAEARPGSPAKLFLSPKDLQNMRLASASGTLWADYTKGDTVKLFTAVETETSSENKTESAPFTLDSSAGDKYRPNSGAFMGSFISPIALWGILIMVFINQLKS